MYVEMKGRLSPGIKGQFLAPSNVCEMIAKMTMGDNGDKPINVLNPAVYTWQYADRGS